MLYCRFFSMLVLIMITSQFTKAQIKLVTSGKSEYRIVIPAAATAHEQHAGEVLAKYLQEISGVLLPIQDDVQEAQAKEICIGNTNRSEATEQFSEDSFLIRSSGEKLFMRGTGKGSLYAVYHWLENYLGCRKYSASVKFIPKKKDIILKPVNDLQKPQLKFRQVYYPDQYDEEYRDWHKLQLLEDEWGLWGHSYDKLLPAATYFKTHPEYFALVNGERKDSQLCLSNPEVLNIVLSKLESLVKADPGKKYWSISQNDGFGYCTCSKCAAFDHKHGGPQASVLNFANEVANRFPDLQISTLAYLYSMHPPSGLKSARNLSIMLSSINQNRAYPIATDPRSAGFRNDLKGWAALTSNLMIWDYVVQFTNYLSPFPNMSSLQPNMNYFGSTGISGAFIQGSEATLGEFSALKAYLLAKLSWNPKLDIGVLKSEFMTAYYGKAAAHLIQYQAELEKQLHLSKSLLDIYGDPVAEWNTWLSPEQMVRYDELFELAEQAVRGNALQTERVQRERLALEYAVLQQARFYGIEKHGVFLTDGSTWGIRPHFEEKVNRFIKKGEKLGVKELAEAGPSLKAYAEEWSHLLKRGPLLHKALGKKVMLLSAPNEDYPAKGPRTLTDGSMGYDNFQYNYLGWLAGDMEVMIDLGSALSCTRLTAGFLEDQRHWAFLPQKIEVSISTDGKQFTKIEELKTPVLEENYQKETHRLAVELPAIPFRFVKVKAFNLKQLPDWRDFPNRKPWLFCDEITVD